MNKIGFAIKKGDKYIPYKATDNLASKDSDGDRLWIRTTAGGTATNHRGLTYTSDKYGKVVQYPYDFGSAGYVNYPIVCDTDLKYITGSSKYGNYSLLRSLDDTIEVLIVHHNKHQKGVIKAYEPISYVAPKTENGGYTPHSHINVGNNGNSRGISDWMHEFVLPDATDPCEDYKKQIETLQRQNAELITDISDMKSAMKEINNISSNFIND